MPSGRSRRSEGSWTSCWGVCEPPASPAYTQVPERGASLSSNVLERRRGTLVDVRELERKNERNGEGESEGAGTHTTVCTFRMSRSPIAWTSVGRGRHCVKADSFDGGQTSARCERACGMRTAWCGGTYCYVRKPVNTRAPP